MKGNLKNLLPGRIYNRIVLTYRFSKNKSRFPQIFVQKISWGFRRLNYNLNYTNYKFFRFSLIIFLILSLSGYYPTLTIPKTFKQSKVFAYDAQDQKGEVVASSFAQPLILPHPGYLSQKFSKWHPGVDIASGLGMPVHPITSGTVEQVNFSFWGLGNHLTVSHPEGFKSLYAHLGKIFAKKGQQVSSENILGEVGMSGWTSGPHTHLEITYNGKYIDPQTLLPEIPSMPASLSLQRGEPKPEFITQQSHPLK